MLLNKSPDDTIIKAQSNSTLFVSRKLFQIENWWLNEPNL